MDIRKLQKIAVVALEDIKGEDIEVIDTKKLTALFDRIIVVTGNSNRQTRALARNLQDKVREAGGTVYGVEGEDGGEWVLVDLGDIIAHIMLASVRAYYNLEELWQAAPKRATKARDGEAAPATVSPAPRKRGQPAAAGAEAKDTAPAATRRPAAVRRTVAPKTTADAAAPAPRRRRTPGKTA